MARLSAERSARNASTSSGVGSVPVRSSRTRRRKVASSARGDTGSRSTVSVLRTSSSMKLARGSPERSTGVSAKRQREPDRHDAVEEAGDDDVLPAAADGRRASVARVRPPTGRTSVNTVQAVTSSGRPVVEAGDGRQRTSAPTCLDDVGRRG